MELSKTYISEKNKQYKNNIKSIAIKKGITLKELSIQLGMEEKYVSNMCAKKDSIVSNNMLHKISILLKCSLVELNQTF